MSSLIKVAILGDASSLSRASAEGAASLGKLDASAETSGQKLAGIAKKALLLGAGFVAAIGVIAVKNGDTLNESSDRLKNALRNAGESMKSFGGGIEPLQKKMEGWGYTNADVNLSLAALTTGGIKAKDALKDETLVADIARYKHISLSDATLLVTKAAQGFTKPLKSLGVDLPIASAGAAKLKVNQDALTKAGAALKVVQDKIHSGMLKGPAAINALKTAQDNLKAAQQKVNDSQTAGGQILDALSKKFKGSAQTAAESLRGKMEALKAKFTDLTAHLGQKLIPVLIKVVTWLDNAEQSAEKWFKSKSGQEFLERMQRGLDKINGFLSDFHDRVDVAGDKFQRFSDRMMDGTHKVGKGISDIVDHFVQLYHWGENVIGKINEWKNNMQHGVDEVVKWFEDLPSRVAHGAEHSFDSVTQAWKDATGWIWGRVNDVVGWFAGLPGRIAAVASNAFHSVTDAVSNAAGWIWGELGSIVDWWGGLPGRIGGVISGLASAISNPFTTAFGWVKSAWNNTVGGFGFSIPSWVPGVGGDSFHIPTMHTGGIFGSGQGEGLALLKDGEGVFTQDQMKALGGLGNRVVINMPAGARGSDVVQAQRRYARGNGLT